jgi:hypothetical protein
MSRQVLAAKRKRLVNKACVTKPRLSTHWNFPTNDFYSNEIQQRFPSKYILHFRYTILSKTCGHYFLKSHTLL